MPIQARGPDGRIFRFPDDTKPSVVSATIRDHYARQQQDQDRQIENMRRTDGDLFDPTARSTFSNAGPADPQARREYIENNDLDVLPSVGDNLARSLAGSRTSRTMLDNARRGTFAEDAGRDNGFIDRAGSLLERGAARVDQGFYSAISQLTGSPVARDMSDILAESTSNVSIAGETTPDDVKDNWLNAPGFVLSAGVESLPYMAAAAIPYAGVPAVGTSMTGNIADERAANDGREGEADASDFLTAAPFGFGSALLERVGVKVASGAATKIVGPNAATALGRAASQTAGRRIGAAAATEGLTEGIQSSLEYAGGTVGTEAGFDLAQMGEEAFFGALAGAPLGGAIRGAVETVDAGGRLVNRRREGDNRVPAPGLREQANEAPVALTAEDQASPIPDNVLSAGKQERLRSDAASAADVALSEAGLPPVGRSVVIGYPEGKTETGTITDFFQTDEGSGVIIQRDDGRVLREFFDTLTDAEISINEAPAPAKVPAAASPASQQQDAPPPASLPSSPASGGAPFNMDTYLASNRAAESSGNDQAAATTSSAFGRYQFTQGTWLEYYRRTFGDTGESREQILAKRGDGDVQDRVMETFTLENVRALEADGLPVDNGTVYLAHFLGQTDAKRVLANPDAAIADVVRAASINANPGVFNGIETAGDLISWARGKMGVEGGGAGTASAPEPFQFSQALQEAGEIDVDMPDIPAANARERDVEQPEAVEQAEITVPELGQSAAARETAEEQPYSPREGKVYELKKPDDYAALRQVEQAEPVLDLQGEPTGWLQVRMANGDGTNLVHSTRDEVRQFTGTGWAQYSGAFAIDNAAPDIRGPAIDEEFTSFAPESGTLNVPRAQMPQIASEDRSAMVQFLKARGIDYAEQTVPAVDLKPTQAEFSEAKVQKAKDYTGGNRAILVSSDGHVLDGHHQWLAARDAGEDIRIIELNAPIRDLLQVVPEMPSATVDEGTASAGQAAEAGVDQPDSPKAATAQPSGVPEARTPSTNGAPDGIAPSARVEPTSTGKSVAVIGASEAEVAAITEAVPKARAVKRKDGALVYSKKYEGDIRAAVEGVNQSAVSKRPEMGVTNSDGEASVLETNTASAPTNTTPSQGVELPSQAGPPAPAAPIPARTEDVADVAVTPAGTEVPVRYAVVELGDLTASNTQDGAINPAYPQNRQPRDRSRAASMTQVADIAANLNPRLLGRSAKASDGAPVISPDGVVERGNGRTLALQKVYGENGQRADAYRAFVEQEGFDTTDMQQPVLVRIRDENMSEADVQAFVRDANARDTAAMSGTETAASDAEAMSADLLGLYRGGDVDAAANRDFVKAFMGKMVPTSEQGGLVMGDGTIAAPLVRRIEASLLVKAVGQQPFIESIVDVTDTNIKALGKALIDVAGPLAQLREAVADGRVDASLDISQNIGEAVALVDRARREQRPLTDYVNQTDIFSGSTVDPITEAVLNLFFNRPRFVQPSSQKRVAERLGFYIEEAGKAAPGGGLFGPSTATQPEDILARANERDRQPEAGQPDLLSRPSRGNERDGQGVQQDSRDGERPAGESALSEPVQQGQPEGVEDAPANPVEGDSQTAAEPAEDGGNPPETGDSPTAPIEDFGEELLGARKHYAAEYAERVRQASDLDVTDVPLSKSWPEPNYEKLIEDGADPYTVAWVHAARDEIPQKPRKGWKLKGWAENVQVLRGFAEKLLAGDITADSLRSKLDTSFSKSLADLQGRTDLYMEVGHTRSLKGISLRFHHYSLYKGRENVDLWAVEQQAKATAFSNWPREIATGATREEALAEFKEKLATGALDAKKPRRGPKFEIYSYRSKPGKFIIGFKNGKNTIDLKEFDTVKEARTFRVSDEGDAWLLEQVAKFRDVPDHRRTDNSPRIGINHRNGGDVTPEQFTEAFGFRGVQFGNYVEGARRQEDLNEAYDSLMDLAGVIGVPSRALSLNGELGLAFGARGKGGKGAPKAHYEPGTVVINLTKKAGAGSLAHEWWHSLDNYFSRARGDRASYLTAKPYERGDGVRPEMVEAFAGVMRAIKQTGLQERSKNLDKRRTKAYWGTDIEMSARAFESYVIAKLQDESFSNDYLANIVSEKAWQIEGEYPYLTAGEIAPVRAAYDAFFETVETRETDHGVELYSRPEDLPEVDAVSSDWGTLPEAGQQRLEILRGRFTRWYREELQGTSVTTSDGREVQFGKAGRGKTPRAGEDILLRSRALRSILADGTLLSSEASTQPGIKAVHRYGANVAVDGADPMPLVAIVREAGDGTFHYSLNRYVTRDDSADADGEAKRSFAPALDGDARAEFNLVPLSEDFNEGAARSAVDVEALTAQLEAAGISNKARLALVETLGGAAGAYSTDGERLIRVALDQAGVQDPVFTVNHEIVHALKEMGLINTSDWAILAAKAKRDIDLTRSIARRYAKLDAEGRSEEAVADMYARWQRGDYETKGTVERIFKRLSAMFEAIRNAFAGRGLRTAEGVMADISRGQASSRVTPRDLPRDPQRLREMVVWHGGPNDHDEFSTNYIGTGEGAQVYGWGLYFASRKEVAQHYREQLSRALPETPEGLAQNLMDALEGNADRAISELQKRKESWEKREPQFRVEGFGAKVDKAIASIRDGSFKKGRLYEVDIPEDGEYLLWDKRLSEQPESVQEALENAGLEITNSDLRLVKGVNPNRLSRGWSIVDENGVETAWYAQKEDAEGALSPVGEVAYRELSRREGSDRAASLMLKNVGIRGIKYLDGNSRAQGEGSYNYVIFDGADAQILNKYSVPERNDMVELGGTDPTWKGKAGDAFDRWRRWSQDRYMPLLKVQREIEQQTGKALPNNLNPYLGEELMSGRIGAQLENLTEDMVAPLFDAMAEEKVTTDELETYLYARHAPERNARIFEINPDFAEGEGSGMTDIEARAIMNRIKNEGRTEVFERLAKRVDAMRDFAVDYRVKTGLMSEEQAEAWRDTYEFYVPLRGFKEVEGEATRDDQVRINRSGGGINVRGSESRAAYGRRSQADSPLAYLILQAEEAIVRGETNRVAQRFVDLAKANPDDDFWKVNKAQYKRRMNPDTGLVEDYLVNQVTADDKDFTVIAKFDGKERRVTMNRNNPKAARLADSMRRLSEHQLDFVTKYLGMVNRFLSQVNTSYNPEFVITNALRDLQTATINAQGLDVDKLGRGILKDYLPAMKAATQGAFRKGEGEWSRWYKEFKEEGGSISFNHVEDIGLLKKRMHKAMDLAQAKAGQGSARIHVKRGLVAVGDIIQNMNSGVENAVRLAAYKNAREAGVSKEKAASLAKNLTVNFNRRGTAGPFINAAYLFYNASIQGSVRIFQAMRSKKVQRILAGVVAGGFMLEMLNAMLSGEDDDGESYYDKIPDYEKERNLIVMTDMDGGYIKIPLPYGYNAFFGAGRTAAEIARRGGEGWKESAGDLIGTVVDAFNPVGGTESVLNFISPTILDPVVDLEQNRDFAGNPIMPEQPAYGPPEPDSQRYWGSVAPHWKAVTDFLSTSTGGDGIQEGAVEVSPETLEYLSGTATGAAGATIDRVIGAIGKGLDPSQDVEINDIMFLRKVVGQKPGWYDKSAYYDRQATFDLHFGNTEDYLDAENIEGARAYVQQHAEIIRLEPVAKQAARDMRQIRKDRRAVEHDYELGRIDETQRRQALDLISEAERLVVQAFNTAWNASMDQGD